MQRAPNAELMSPPRTFLEQPWYCNGRTSKGDAWDCWHSGNSAERVRNILIYFMKEKNSSHIERLWETPKGCCDCRLMTKSTSEMTLQCGVRRWLNAIPRSCLVDPQALSKLRSTTTHPNWSRKQSGGQRLLKARRRRWRPFCRPGEWYPFWGDFQGNILAYYPEKGEKPEAYYAAFSERLKDNLKENQPRLSMKIVEFLQFNSRLPQSTVAMVKL